MILCVGEILADMIGEEKNGTYFYERKAGGAPFNVACAVKKFGGNAAFAGSVGDDLIGEYLISFANERNLDCTFIDKVSDRNTTLAFVQLDKNGERSFCFYRKNTADFCMPELSDVTLAKACIVHIGSLMLSEENGLEYASGLAERAHRLKKSVSFDVNFRTDIFKDSQTAIKRYKQLLETADIIKFSEEETEIFGEDYISTKLKNKLLCISLGSRGSQWRYNGESSNVESVNVKPVDTTGAGDAFFAGVLKGLDGVPRDGWNRSFLNGVFKVANVCGALNTLGRGAIDALPDPEDIENTLNDLSL